MRAATFAVEEMRATCPEHSDLEPVIVYRVSERYWFLMHAFRVEVSGVRFHVPAGFSFDLASVPRAVWPLIAPFELSIAAPLVHDALYEHRGHLPPGWVMPERVFSRVEADRIFADLMRREGIPAWRRAAAYRAVRAFGPRW